MADNVFVRMRNAWNAFTNDSTRKSLDYQYGQASYSMRPDRVVLTGGNERSIIPSVYNRFSLDTAQLAFKHIVIDPETEKLSDEKDSSLNNILNLEANIDQGSRAFMQDIVLKMLDQGVVAVCPIDVNIDPNETEGFKILSMRTGRITEWRPSQVRVEVYDDRAGIKKEIWFAKNKVGIIQNPFFIVMNDRNSTMQRLKRKIALLDKSDENNFSGRLDMVIQLPYVVRSEQQRQEAEKRRQNIEMQLTSSKYGVAYTDGTEKIVQLNRPIENNLLEQIKELKEELLAQLGITQGILDGSANEDEMTNYMSRVIRPIADIIIEEFTRKFISKTARTQGQVVFYFMDPFKLMPVSKIADTADKLTRNEIMSSNEFRQKIGLKPSTDPEADALRNKNLNAPTEVANNQPDLSDPNESGS